MRCVVLVLVLATLGSSASAMPYVDLIVPGTSDPWLSGMPDGTNASVNDYAPAQSPVHVTGLSLVPGGLLHFGASGLVGNGPSLPGDGPDGGSLISHLTGAENGVSEVYCPINSLIGVFLSDEEPALTGAPAAIDFSGGAGRFNRATGPADLVELRRSIGGSYLR